MRERVAEVERKKIQVIVDVIGITVELGIAVNLEMLAGIEQRPGGRRKTDGANIEVLDARALLRENVIDPGQIALAGGGVDVAEFAFQQIVRNAVQFDDDNAFDFGAASGTLGESKKKNERHPVAPLHWPPPSPAALHGVAVVALPWK